MWGKGGKTGKERRGRLEEKKEKGGGRSKKNREKRKTFSLRNQERLRKGRELAKKAFIGKQAMRLP